MNDKQEVVTFAPARLPWHPEIEKKFNIDRGDWKVLVETVFPSAKSVDVIVLALSYCKHRNLDIMKKPVHIVPIWDKEKAKMVEGIWPGINEFRITASRTGSYAGKDETEFGPDVTENVGVVPITYPKWAQITLYRIINGKRVAFVGPRVFWKETYGSIKDGSPNTMWTKRPYGQIEKCAEAAALRSAFPEEIGNEHTIEELGNVIVEATAIDNVPEKKETRTEEIKEKLRERAKEVPALTTQMVPVVELATEGDTVAAEWAPPENVKLETKPSFKRKTVENA